MSDDVIQVAAEEHHNDINDLAAEYGWNPEGEKSASEFIKVALDKFPEQSKKIKQLFKAVDEMKDHMSKTEKVAYERAKSELEAERKQAIKAGDVSKVEELEQAQLELTSKAIDTEAELPPAIKEFEERNNTWLQGSSFEEIEMQQWVESHGAYLGRKKLPVDEHMALLEEHLKKKFPAYFQKDDDSTEPSSPVIGVSQGNPGKKKKSAPTFKDLSPEQQSTCTNYKNLGIMSVEKYIKDLVDHGEL